MLPFTLPFYPCTWPLGACSVSSTYTLFLLLIEVGECQCQATVFCSLQCLVKASLGDQVLHSALVPSICREGIIWALLRQFQGFNSSFWPVSSWLSLRIISIGYVLVLNHKWKVCLKSLPVIANDLQKNSCVKIIYALRQSLRVRYHNGFSLSGKPYKVNLCWNTCCATAEDGPKDFITCAGFQAAPIYKQQTSGILLCLWELFVKSESFLFYISKTDSPSLSKHNN